MTRPAFILGLPQRDATRLSLAAVERYEAGLIDGVMLSASSLWEKRGRRGPRFVEPTCALEGAPLVIDSAGFVAASQWGGYPWTADAYVEFIATMRHRPVWWSSMDLCCEPEVAKHRAVVRERIEETATLLARCRHIAAAWREVTQRWRSGLGLAADADTLWPQPPVPILQGWTPDDYLYSAELTDVVLTTRGLAGRWPDLVGLGSVCRRRLQGEDGLLAIVSRLDRTLPAHVKLHLFGVHSEAIEPLIAAYGHRFASYDSQAWARGRGTTRRPGAARSASNSGARSSQATPSGCPATSTSSSSTSTASPPPRPRPGCPLNSISLEGFMADLHDALHRAADEWLALAEAWLARGDAVRARTCLAVAQRRRRDAHRFTPDRKAA